MKFPVMLMEWNVISYRIAVKDLLFYNMKVVRYRGGGVQNWRIAESEAVGFLLLNNFV
jgi:hypothetical protein